jgi:hypothetical protein
MNAENAKGNTTEEKLNRRGRNAQEV